MKRPRVLVIDDSAFARLVLTKIMTASGFVDVVGEAADGQVGLERMIELDPDVITLDLTMPGCGGIDVLRALAGRTRPRVLVVSSSSVDTEIGAEALLLGAIDVIHKPPALASDQHSELAVELVAKVRAAFEGYQVPPPLAAPAVPVRVSPRPELIMIGTSTGGPQALTRLLAALPANLSVPVAVVLHIPAGYTEALAQRLDKVSRLDVVEAQHGMALAPGMAMIARGGMHLFIDRAEAGLRARLAARPPRPFTPSVDELFTSGAAAVGAGALGVVLTGMGDDGLVGARTIAAAGGGLLTQSASTCVVYGMPRCIDDAKLGAVSLSIEALAEEIIRRV